MIAIRRDAEIYEAEGGWFHARWHFSFDQYYDPAWVQFGSLRVFNDDRLIPGVAWPMHPHKDIEGLTYVVEGTFKHADNLGRDDQLMVLPAGSVQRMTLGSGAWHSEQNASDTEPLRFIQMWIIPRERGLEPSVEQRVFTKEDRTDRLRKVVSGDGGNAVLVHQDAAVFVSALTEGTAVSHDFSPGRGAYLYLIGGAVGLNDEKLATGDAAKITDEAKLELVAQEPSELIMVEVDTEA
jgi:redox-sensitive bicupin YhaK (pirin superfamily)